MTMTLEIVDCYKYLGVHLDEYLTCSRVTSTLSAAGSRAFGGMITKYKQVQGSKLQNRSAYL